MDVERCDECGFAWDEVRTADLPVRLVEGAGAIAVVLRSGAPGLRTPPDPGVWSPVEYAGHVRDVLFNLRDRIVFGLAVDNPTPAPMFATLRVDEGLYALDDPETVAVEVASGSSLLARTVRALDEARLARPIFYPWPTPATRTLRWVAAQALHEVEHHLGDIRRGATPPPS